MDSSNLEGFEIELEDSNSLDISCFGTPGNNKRFMNYDISDNTCEICNYINMNELLFDFNTDKPKYSNKICIHCIYEDEDKYKYAAIRQKLGSTKQYINIYRKAHNEKSCTRKECVFCKNIKKKNDQLKKAKREKREDKKKFMIVNDSNNVTLNKDKFNMTIYI